MGSNAKTDVAAAASATPRVGTRLLLATNFKLFNSSTSQLQDQPTCQDGRVQDQAELPRGLRGVDQQADQHGILCLLRLSLERGARHGMKLMEYQTKRGGRVVFQDIAKPTTMDWGSPMEAMEAAL